MHTNLGKGEFLTPKQMVRSDPSSASEIIVRLQLTRQVGREVYRQLKDDRSAQATLTSVLGATRSKYP